MFDPQQDRRQARSENTQVALTRLLESARRSAELEALALGDELGLLMAGAGAAELCDELAAVGPLFGSATFDRGTEIRRLAVDGCELFVCARGQNPEAALAHALAGCARILIEKKSRVVH